MNILLLKSFISIVTVQNGTIKSELNKHKRYLTLLFLQDI